MSKLICKAFLVAVAFAGILAGPEVARADYWNNYWRWHDNHYAPYYRGYNRGYSNGYNHPYGVVQPGYGYCAHPGYGYGVYGPTTHYGPYGYSNWR